MFKIVLLAVVTVFRSLEAEEIHENSPTSMVEKGIVLEEDGKNRGLKAYIFSKIAEKKANNAAKESQKPSKRIQEHSLYTHLKNKIAHKVVHLVYDINRVVHNTIYSEIINKGIPLGFFLIAATTTACTFKKTNTSWVIPGVIALTSLLLFKYEGFSRIFFTAKEIEEIRAFKKTQNNFKKAHESIKKFKTQAKLGSLLLPLITVLQKNPTSPIKVA